jgi:oligosaccharyltransferase complex subunit beta
VSATSEVLKDCADLYFAALSQDLTPQKLIDFLKDNGNVLITVSPELSEMYRDFAREFDLELEERGTQLIDHFSSLQDDSAHNSVIVPPSGHLQQLSGVFPGVKFRLPFVYKGIAHRIGNNPLAFPILKPTTTSYSFEPPSVNSSLEKLDNPDRNVLLGSDADASLISAFQLLNTDRRNVDQTTPKRTGSAGRAVWCGSMAAFSNEFVDAKRVKGRDGTSYPGTSNLQVLTTMISWLTQQHGVLRVDSTSHERVKQHENDDRESYEEWQIEQNGETKHIQRMYRVQDIVTYHVDISQHTPSGWTPGPTDLDLQVSLVMLDPFITTNLTAASPQSLLKSLNTSSSSSTTMTPAFTRYSSTFKLPDKHGVYTFVVDWKRHGWSYIHTRDTAPVRPFNHDEHPRGLHSAWPYVTGASTTVVAFLIFVVIWVCSDERDDIKRGKKAQ